MNPLSPEELDQCIELLQRLCDSYRSMEPDDRLRGLIRKLYREGSRGTREHRREVRQQQRQEDRALLADTELVKHQRDTEAPKVPCKPCGAWW